jgi:hypothetical protein
MQIYHYGCDAAERRIARKWRLASVGFYGSILTMLIVYAIFNESPDARLAAGDLAPRSSVASMSPPPAAANHGALSR